MPAWTTPSHAPPRRALPPASANGATTCSNQPSSAEDTRTVQPSDSRPTWKHEKGCPQMTHNTALMTEEQVSDMLERFADGFCYQRRSPILHAPEEVGLDYENVSFPASDGVPLEGWFIPAPGSDTLIIANHPMGFNRSGMPTPLEPWNSQWASS